MIRPLPANLGRATPNTVSTPHTSVTRHVGAGDAARKKDVRTSVFNRDSAKPVSSISRSSYESSQPKTSALTPSDSRKQHATSAAARRHGLDDATEQGADEKRHEYIRRLVKQRRAMEKKTGTGAYANKAEIPVQTGPGFNTKKFNKKLMRVIRSKPGSYRHISMEDRKYFSGLVKKYAKRRKAGHGFSYKTRRHMRAEVDKQWRSHNISKEDRKTMRKWVDQMKND